jgi:putative membrane protein
MPSELPPTAAGDAPAPRERRLHPWSWLFVLVQQLKQFALPLLVLLVTGRGDRNELWPLIGVGVLALVSVAQYFTYRYRVGAEGLTIRSGLLQRTVRHIPFARVHNVALQQSLLHRVFGVAEVRLESAGGVRPEASMRVLSLRDAQALERIVREHAQAAPAGSEDAAAAAPPLLVLDAR